MERSLFEEIEIGESRRDRAIARIERQMVDCGIAAIQRAVIWLIVGHPDSKVVGDELRLAITLDDAVEWIKEFAGPADGLACAKSNVLRAINKIQRDGVLRALQAGPRKLITLSQSRFTDWLTIPTFSHLTDLLDRDQSLPTVTHRDPSLQTMTGHDRPLPTVTHRDRDSDSEESELNDSHSFDSSESVTSDDWPKVLPQELWTMPDTSLRSEITAFSGLRNFPAFVGAVQYVRKAPPTKGGRRKNPDALYCKTRDSPAPYLAKNGERWLSQTRRAIEEPDKPHMPITVSLLPEDRTADDPEVAAAIESVRNAVGETNFDRWFKRAAITIRDDTLVVRVASPFFQTWINKNFAEALKPLAIRVAIESADVGPMPATTTSNDVDALVRCFDEHSGRPNGRGG